MSDEPDDVISVVRAGARGYVTKHIDAAELVDAVRRVAEGDAVFSPRLAGFVLDAFAGQVDGDRGPGAGPADPPGAGGACGTWRGATPTRRSPAALHISVKTVETHVSSVLRKLQLSSRHELARWAMGRRLL